MKDKKELVRLFYLNQNQIAELLDVSRMKAKVIFDKADALDDEKYQDDRIEFHKVSMDSVCTIYGIKYCDLIKRITMF